jgi:phospholipid-translocating ATPase
MDTAQVLVSLNRFLFLLWTLTLARAYMADGIYQSAIAFFSVYLLFSPATFNTANGLGLDELKRMGVFVATIAVCAANFYVLFNTYRWDWLMVLIVVISTLFVWFWTGVYTSTLASYQFYKAAAEVYGSLAFWAVLLVAVIICLLPRFLAKAVQKIYFPLDVDIIREQVRLGKFDYLKDVDSYIPPPPPEKITSTTSQDSKYKAADIQPGDDDTRPMYPPSVAPTAATHNHRSQNGSNSTDYTFRRSLEGIPSQRISLDRPRPSFDRARFSMDRVRPSFEASNDFTSAAMLSRMESRQSTRNSIGSAPAGAPEGNQTMSKLRNAFRRPTVTREEDPNLGHDAPPLPRSPPRSPPR